MIVGPDDWNFVGIPVKLVEILQKMKEIIKQIDCFNLALSGGVDSALMLSLMVQVFGCKKIRCFNIAGSLNHPDYFYSDLAAKHFEVRLLHWIPGCLAKKENDFPGDEIVREFYRWVCEDYYVQRIIACDGVDEFNGGYYEHIKAPVEETYYKFIRKLQKEQLEPLDRNSGNVKIYLPYIYKQMVLLWAQIPLAEKIDHQNRKKIIQELAIMNDVPEEIIDRRKYGFVDAMGIK